MAQDKAADAQSTDRRKRSIRVTVIEIVDADDDAALPKRIKRPPHKLPPSYMAGSGFTHGYDEDD